MSSQKERREPPPIPEPVGRLIDAHTHLDACGAVDADDVRVILDRAGQAGVAAVVTIADDLDAARWAARNLVDAGAASCCEIQLAYAIGVAQPVSIFVDTFGTGKLPDEQLASALENVFDFQPQSIIDQLDLRTPIFLPTAAYGHFGRTPESLGADPEHPGIFEEKIPLLGKEESEAIEIDLLLVDPNSNRRFIVIRIVSVDDEQAFGTVVAQDQLRQLELQPR